MFLTGFPWVFQISACKAGKYAKIVCDMSPLSPSSHAIIHNDSVSYQYYTTFAADSIVKQMNSKIIMA
jgi:hypothetical protein